MKSREDVKKLMESVFQECMATREEGQKEYAHKDENALANFEEEARETGITRFQVWRVFANKHWRGVTAWIRGHRSQREDVRGRIKDLIVYLVLLWAMIDDESATKT